MSDMGNGWGPPPGSSFPDFPSPPAQPQQQQQPGYAIVPAGMQPVPPQYPVGYPYNAGYAPTPQLPSSVTSVGLFMLVSGVKGAILSAAWILSLIWVCVGAFWFL